MSNKISDDPNHKIIEQHFGIYGCGALMAAAASWFVPGFPALFIGLIAVAAGFWGSREQEKFSQTALCISSITIIFVNLVNIGIVPTSHFVHSDKAHIINSINDSIKIFNTIKSGKLDDQDKKKLILHIENAIEEAKKVNIKTVDQQVNGFSTHYTGEFIKGMEALKLGYGNNNFLKKIQGAVLIDKWAQWNQQNRKNLGQLKEPKLSLVTFLYRVIIPVE